MSELLLIIRGQLKRVSPWLLLITLLVGMPVMAQPSPKITINGGTEAIRYNVRQHLTIAEENCSAPLWRLKSLMVDGETEIEQAAQALGYYQIKFTTNLTEEAGCWQLNIQITPGERVKITEFKFVVKGDGENDKAFKELQNNPEIRIGDGLDHGLYENLKNRITNLATTHGYFDGRFESSRITVNSLENTAAVELIYDTDVRYRIGEIRMQHNILDEKFLNKFLNIKTGDLYDADKLLELKTLYNASNYFSVATASPDLQNLHDHTIDVDVQLEERKRFAYSVGLGAASDTGARVLLGFENRYVNGRGHSLTADVSLAKEEKTTEVAYTIPLAKPTYEFLKVYTGVALKDTEIKYSNKKTLGASYTRYLKTQWLQTYAFNIENESYRISDQNQESFLLIPSVSFLRTKTDGNLAYPLNGWSIMTRFSGSPETLGSDISYAQLYMRAKYIHPLKRGRLLVRTEMGITDVNASLLPASVRYFAGGANSVRGYDYESLGPTGINEETDEEKVIGGNNLLVGSLEYDYQFRPNWAAAAFVDVGNAADDFHWDFKRGVGLGLRWISPIGPVRIDVAYGLDPTSLNQKRGIDKPAGWNFNISMGPDL
ncbi:MAG: outer membrane protein assembly factor [Gammaproteobacteria bacterium]|nr:MAG: outer membrane protein assembly factor [Gammaproteobacteria bacterium]